MIIAGVRSGVLAKGWTCPRCPARSNRARGGPAIRRRHLRILPALRLFLVRGVCTLKSGALLHGLTHNMACGFRLIAA
ncbi:MAG: hypothetical protein ACREC4_04960 [Methylocella sp.]